MIPFTMMELSKITNGKLVGDNIQINKISTDSRNCVCGSLFIALQGKNFDANNFIKIAINKGAIALLTNKNIIDAKIPQIIVNDTTIALGQLSKLIRKKSSATVIALTGSSGKTTVKEMITNILNYSGKTLSNNGNFNNHIGVPLTLTCLNKEHKYLVLEMGANSFGEINYLTKLVRPQSALINNILPSHLSGFHSINGVANAKGEIFNGLVNFGTAIINDNSNDILNWNKNLKNKRILCYSDIYSLRSHIWASNIHTNKNNIIFNINTFFSEQIKIKMSLLGRHNILNALAAATLAISINIPLNIIKKGLFDTKPIPGRMYPIHINNKKIIIDDTYNANYGSMIAAIRVLNKMPGYLVIVIGDILELGHKYTYYYNKIGKFANFMRINKIISFGNYTNIISNISRLGEHFYKKKDLINRLIKLLSQKKEITILIKGSRVVAMDTIVSILKEKTGVNNK